jgi:catechol 2,3-dioxygenase-like lactoylglutathione lyase family enzyme
MLQNSHGFSSFSISNAQATKDFYTNMLGLEVTETGMGLELHVEGCSVFMYEKPDHVPATFTVLNFAVDDIDAVVDELTQKGVTFERYDNLPASADEKGILRGKAAGQGPDIAWLKDPSGNVLAILSN